MFCTGAAPAVPGIRLRFSSPHKPRESDQRTTSFQCSPPAIRKRAERSSSPAISMPRVFSVTIRPSKLPAKSTLLPSPSTSVRIPRSAGHSSNFGSAFALRTSASKLTRASTCSVLRARSDVFSSKVQPPSSTGAASVAMVVSVLSPDFLDALRQQPRSAIDQARINLHEACAGIELFRRVAAGEHAADADQWNLSFESLRHPAQDRGRLFEQWPARQTARFVRERLRSDRGTIDRGVGADQAVDARVQRRLCDRIHLRLIQIRRDLQQHGFADAMLPGELFLA